MKLKIAALASAIAATAFTGTAMAYDVRIDINGQLTSSTCQIDTANSPLNKTINLPTLSTNSLNAAGSHAGRTPLTLSISNCEAETTATVNFEASSVNVTPAGTLKNLATTDAAANVELQLLDGSAQVLNLNTDTPSYNIDGGKGSMTLYAQYYSPNGNVQSGAVSSYIEMSMNYN